ncbi:hypothetical protein ETB92_03560 [Lactobacillus delbrueckii subsp. bulgaricus]|nr:hypothetical protein CYJ84_06075 [Lactobacillus delbrueckii]RXS49213.1 hypothetical protein ETB92_03560 [Lactobacillus delbrueckii subsp. bulgaricus]
MLDVKTLKSAAYVASILRNISRYKFSKVKVISHKMACFLTTRSRSVPAAMNLDGEKKEAAKYHLVVQPKSLNLVI